MPTILTLPACYGTAVDEMYSTTQTLTFEQRDQLDQLLLETSGAMWKPARQQLDTHDELAVLDALADTLDEQTAVLYPILAVYARDLGMITAGDFDALTTWWVAAGLPLPEVVTGDDETGSAAPIDTMTSDLICDALRSASHGTPEYGAVLALTGYNHGELLAYPFVRGFVGRSARDQSLFVDWAGLNDALDKGEGTEVDGKSQDVLSFAITLNGYGDLAFDEVVTAATISIGNLEALGLAAVHTLAATHLFTTSPDMPASRQREPQS